MYLKGGLWLQAKAAERLRSESMNEGNDAIRSSSMSHVSELDDADSEGGGFRDDEDGAEINAMLASHSMNMEAGRLTLDAPDSQSTAHILAPPEEYSGTVTPANYFGEKARKNFFEVYQKYDLILQFA
jgi:hypothetical protein